MTQVEGSKALLMEDSQREQWGWKFQIDRSSKAMSTVMEKMNSYASQTFEIGSSQLEELIKTQEEVRQMAVLHQIVEHFDGDFEQAREAWAKRLRSDLLDNRHRSGSTSPMSNAIEEIKREVASRLYREHSGDKSAY